MIIGIGTDMIEVLRVKKACEKEAFFSRCFTAEERKMIDGNMQRAAGNFAGKEAVVKAFGTGFRGVRPEDISVLRNELGAPYVILSPKAQKLAEEKGIGNIHISITNTAEYASAFVIAEGKEG